MNTHTTQLDQLRPKIFFKSSPRKEACRTAWENFFKRENIAFRTDRKLRLPRTRDHNIAIFFGSWKDRRDLHHKTKNQIIRSGKNFICCETSLLGRQKVTHKFNENWFRIGINGFLANTANFNTPMQSSLCRWEMIQELRGIEVLPWKKSDGQYITICLQLPGDASLQGADISDWMLQTCRTIREHTDFPIKIRLPQLQRTFKQECIAQATSLPNVSLENGTKENLNKTIDESSFVCTFSSGMGIDAIIRGTPVYAESKASFVHSISTDITNAIAGNFNTPDRDNIFSRLAYCQWSTEEIESGAAWKHLICENNSFLTSDTQKRFYLPFNP